MRPWSGLKAGLAGRSGSSGRATGAVPSGSTVTTIKRNLRVIANPPLLAPAPPMSMKYNYFGIAVVLSVGIWAATRSEEELIKGGFAGILEGVVVDGEDIDDEDDDFADIIGHPSTREGGAGAGGPEGGVGAGGGQGTEAAVPPTKR